MTTPPKSRQLRLVLVDDHRFVRNGLRSMLESDGMVVAGEAATAHEGVRVAAELEPDVVLLDVGLPDASGIDVIPDIRRRAPGAAIVMMTASSGHQEVVGALSAGACAYLLKEAPLEEMIATIRAAAAGESVLSPRIAHSLVEHLRLGLPASPETTYDPRGPDLTERERAVLRLLADGRANPEIAQELSLSVGTVKVHVAELLLKLGVQNRVQAAVEAVRRGLLG